MFHHLDFIILYCFLLIISYEVKHHIISSMFHGALKLSRQISAAGMATFTSWIDRSFPGPDWPS